jgi:signal transduction histidine kinase
MLSDFDLSEKIDEIMQQINPMAELKQLVLCNRIPRGIAVRQYGDPIKTIVLQLLTNSIKYSEHGIIVADAEIRGEEILLAVTDQGIGIPPRIAAQLAGSGEASEFSGFHENTGHGFGFLIIKDMLEIIHGQLQIASVIDEGTKISVRFPATLT